MTSEKDLIELAHKYKMEEITAEKEARLEIEKVRHENALGEVRFKRASIDYTRGNR